MAAISPDHTSADHGRGRILKLCLLVFLLFEYVVIFGFLENYDNAFMHPEKTLNHCYFFENGKSLKCEDLKRGMNVMAIEWAPRVTRPLSNVLELINAKFRVWLWQFVPPHPSLSVFWPLSFGLLPFLLFRFLRNMGCREEWSLAGVCLYVASTGFLCPLMYLFHPSKNMVNVSSMLCLYQVSRMLPLTRRIGSGDTAGDVRSFYRHYIVLFLLVFQSFFWDETGVFVFPLVLAFFLPVFPAFKRSRRLWAACGLYLTLPVLYLVMIKVVLPDLQVALGYPSPSMKDFVLTPSLKDISPTLVARNIIQLIKDSLRWTWNPLNKYPPGVFLTSSSLANMIIVLVLVVAVALAVYRSRPRRGTQDENCRRMCWNWGAAAGLLMAYGVFHGILFSTDKSGGIQGLYYYGSLFSLLFVVFLVFSLSLIIRTVAVRRLSLMIVVFVIGFCVDSLVFTAYRQGVYKVATITFGFGLTPDLFADIRRECDYYSFKKSWEQAGKKRQYAVRFWRSMRDPGSTRSDTNILDESGFVFLDAVKSVLSCELIRTYTGERNFVLQPRQLGFADINGDRKADALLWDTTLRDRGFVKTALSSGSGFERFTEALGFWVEGNTRLDGSGKDAENRMRFADVNGDGLADALYFETWRSYAVYVAFRDKNAFRDFLPCLRYGPSSPDQIQYADVNGDGKADALYFDTRGSGGVWVSLSNGQGFAKPQSWARYGRSDPGQIQYADVNGDGKADAVYFDWKGNAGIHVSVSDGQSFTNAGEWGRCGNASPDQMRCADVNGDGKADAIYYDRDGDRGVWVGLSTGTSFAPRTMWLQHGQQRPEYMRYADVNGDGKADAVWVDPLRFEVATAPSDGARFLEQTDR